mmetsp:Transcript_24285/g.37848  ORF Transcript_24285/g.37848 Transcript_24285/m.37848 type:complete len:185 (-) Transcript_24285:74-628(-)
MNESSKQQVLHPLHQSWVMWYDYQRYANDANPEDGLVNLSSISDVEGFWNVVDSIKPASSLAFGANYHFFKNGIRPEWEDVANSDGGKWTIRIVAEDAYKIDCTWEKVLMSLIGEYVLDPLEAKFPGVDNVVNGAVMARRRLNTRVELWCARCFSEEELPAIEERIREIVEVPVKLEFQPHRRG